MAKAKSFYYKRRVVSMIHYLRYYLCLGFFTTTFLHAQDNLTQFVNPFIGTGAVNGSSLSGNNFPGATVPFGMVQLSPDTREMPDWSVASGYNHNDKYIYGFSHTHLSGTGVSELFDICVFPYSYERAFPLRSEFSHEYESANPGYYQIKLLEDNINVELTATEHSGFHKYTFPPNKLQRILIDLNHSIPKGSWDCKIVAAQIRVVDKYTIEGYRVITGWAPLRKIYFYARFSRPILEKKMWNGNKILADQSIINGTDIKAAFDFGSNDSVVLLKMGISAVSTENAKQNLEDEIPAFDFDKTVSQANLLWENELKKINVEGSTLQKRIFYTAMYHAFTQPNNMSDTNGDYVSADFTKHNSATGNYSTFSLWDMYRAAGPLYTLLQPQKMAAFVNSMIDHYKSFGMLPIWELWGQENYCMIGNHAIPVIVNAIMNRVDGIDVDQAYEAIKHSSLINHLNSPFDVWEKYGYIPENIQSQSVSITLEMSYDDWCVAQLAKKLGKTDDYNRFYSRSEYYKNLYDKQTGFFRAKDNNGKWMGPFNPLQYGANGGKPYTEGNAWQYLWYVPQNIPGLVQLIGGKERFVRRLDSLFTLTDTTLELNSNASGLIGQYAHGNEPSHHISYLFNYVGAPWKTQYYVTKIMKEMYNDSFSGYAGNEDCGQMSAWYIFSSLGFYPVNPAGGVFIIGSPIFQKATLQLPNGKKFIVIAKNVSDKNIYIQSAKLNGVKYSKTYITKSDLDRGGIIEFVMGEKPNKKWGGAPNDAPLNSIF